LVERHTKLALSPQQPSIGGSPRLVERHAKLRWSLHQPSTSEPPTFVERPTKLRGSLLQPSTSEPPSFVERPTKLRGSLLQPSTSEPPSFMERPATLRWSLLQASTSGPPSFDARATKLPSLVYQGWITNRPRLHARPAKLGAAADKLRRPKLASSSFWRPSNARWPSLPVARPSSAVAHDSLTVVQRTGGSTGTMSDETISRASDSCVAWSLKRWPRRSSHRCSTASGDSSAFGTELQASSPFP
jgi:hypothetical protein